MDQEASDSSIMTSVCRLCGFKGFGFGFDLGLVQWVWGFKDLGFKGFGLQRIWVATCITDQSDAWKDALRCCVQRVVLSGGYDKSGV